MECREHLFYYMKKGQTKNYVITIVVFITVIVHLSKFIAQVVTTSAPGHFEPHSPSYFYHYQKWHLYLALYNEFAPTHFLLILYTGQQWRRAE